MKKQLLILFSCMSVVFSFAQGTLVKDISPGTANGLTRLFVHDNIIYMSARDASGDNTGGVDLGVELWKSDGSEAGTELVKDIRPGSAASSPNFYFTYNNSLYFSANEAGTGNVLYTSDGTEAGTTSVGTSFVFEPRELNGQVYNVLTTAANALYMFNGTVNAPAPILPADQTAALLGANMAVLNGKLICRADYSGDSVGRKLYEYDPATSAFTLIKDINPGTANSTITNFTVLGDKMYFTSNTSGDLWETDGTADGTLLVSSATDVIARNLYAWNGKLYFDGDNGTTNRQLWVFNPADQTITQVSNITGGTANNHNPSDYAPNGSFLYYSGRLADNTSDFLFRTNGTNVARIDENLTNVNGIQILSDIVYFRANNGTSGNELFRLDPSTLSTNQETFEVVNVFPNPARDHVIFSQNMIGKSYSIFDASGKQISKGTLTSERLNLNLSNGLYLIKVTSENSIFTKKIIIN